MLNKLLNTKTLIILLVLLVGVYLLSKLTEKDERTFKSELVEVDTAMVSKIIITPKIGDGSEISFTKSGSEWKLESAGKQYTPDKSAASNLLAELIKLKSERVAATDKSRWKEYEVTDSTATRIKLFEGSDLVSDLYIGKFTYQQPKGSQNQYQQSRGKMSTCVRQAIEDEVYVVDGFLRMSMSADVNSYRDKNLFAADKNDLTKVSFIYPENEIFTLKKEQDNHWYLNGQPTDSAKTANYINKLSRTTSSQFMDDVIPLSTTPSHIVKIEGNNIIPVDIKAFPNADSNNPYIITSSLLTDSKFNGKKGKLFENVFADMTDFFEDQENK